MEDGETDGEEGEREREREEAADWPHWLAARTTPQHKTRKFVRAKNAVDQQALDKGACTYICRSSRWSRRKKHVLNQVPEYCRKVAGIRPCT